MEPSCAPELSLLGISLSFGHQRVLDSLDLQIHAGEYLVVLGPSGCGKSTLLQLIAGLLKPDAGEIIATNAALQHAVLAKRDLSILFQDDRLYPHWNLRRNLQIAIRRSPNKERAEQSLQQLARRLGIDTLLERRPDQVSGGQLRRAALAKALLRQPAICLLDEPLTAIDTMLREDVLSLLAEFSRDRDERLPPTAIVHVTHDGDEAMRLADRIVVLGNGRVLQSGTPEQVYRRPSSTEVARAIGSPPANLIAMADLRAMLPKCYPLLRQRFPDASDHSTLVIRPEHIRLVEGHDDPNSDASPKQLPSASLNGDEWNIPVFVQSSRFVTGRYLHRLQIKVAERSGEPIVCWSVGSVLANEGVSSAVISIRDIVMTL